MESRKRKKSERPVFESIRKPTAPPSKKIGDRKPEEKLYPSRRKAKHHVKEDFND